MAVVHYLREGKIVKKDGDVEFDILTIDGIGIAKYSPAVSPGGYPKRINDIINMDTRPGDVILATYPKSGTHWMTEILDMLMRGSAEYSQEKLLKIIEFVVDMDLVINQQSPRLITTHLPYKWFPRKHKQNGGKIIHCIRNPKDTYVSMYHHVSTAMELGEKTKGLTWTQFFDTCVIEKACLYGTWYDYVKEMEQAKKNNKNIYEVYYENIKENPRKEIKAIADFLELQISEDLLKDISEKCLFKNLKQAYDEKKQHPPEFLQLLKEKKEICPDFKYPNIFRKGTVGDWKNHFTVAQNEQFDALYEKELKDSNIKIRD